MIAALQAETRKLASTRLWWVLLVSGAGYLAITAGGLAGFLGYAARQAARGQPVPEDLPAMGGADAARAVYALAGSMAYVFPLLIGVLIVTQEFRHKTVTSTFLAEPARLVVLGAKLAVSLVLGLGYGVVVLAATVAPAAAAFAVFGQDTGLGSPEMWSFLGRATLAFGLWAPLGVALGTLLRNQVAAIVVVLAETQFLEPLIRVVPAMAGLDWPWIKFLPGGAGDAIQGASVYDAVTGSTLLDPLPWPAGVAVLLAWAFVFAVIGYFTTWRRDIT